MTDWWQSLSGLNQTLYGLAICVSVPFVWQFAAALLGLSHDGDLDGTEGDTDAEAAPGDAVATALAFKLLSMRALITFFTLFFWAAALYLERGLPLPRVFGSAVVWGLGGMSSVALLLHLLPRLAHSGTRDLDSALGSEATVYIDIPFGGTGEVRALVSGSVGYIKARSLDGGAIPSGTPVAVRRRIGQTLLVAAFVWPLFQAYEYLDLEPFVVPVDLKSALSSENIRVSVPTTVTAAISIEPGIMENAAVRLLGQSAQDIQNQAQDIILGQMRAVIATMGIEEINRDRQAFLGKVNEAVSGELEKIGLSLINVNIRDIEDDSGYIIALGRRAAAEAINQANIDVAEQEKTGQTGVAERQRDTRVAVAAANATAEIGEAKANRDRRMESAGLDAEAVHAETEAEARKASSRANQHVAEQQARNRAESAAKEADGAIRVAQEQAQKKAEEARAQREAARLEAEVVVPANAERERVLIAADAAKQQSVRVAEGQAEATLVQMNAEARGVQAILDGKAQGYANLVKACASAEQAASLLLIEKLIDVARVQAQAIQDLPIEKIFVWDGGGKQGGLDNLGQRLMGTLPPMHELARQVGIDLPAFLGKAAGTSDAPAPAPAGAPPPTQEPA